MINDYIAYLLDGKGLREGEEVEWGEEGRKGMARIGTVRNKGTNVILEER